MPTKIDKSVNKLEREVQFLQLLQKRLGVIIKSQDKSENPKKHIKSDLAGQATLKRAMSGEPQHVRKVYEFLSTEISISSEWNEKHIWIPVACLFVFYPQKIEEVKDSQKYNFGRSCWDLAIEINKTGESKGTERRFRALLDTSLADIGSPLANLVRQMKSKGVRINYPQLLADLQQWEHPNQYIQDQWARTFWGAAPVDPKDSLTESLTEPVEKIIDPATKASNNDN